MASFVLKNTQDTPQDEGGHKGLGSNVLRDNVTWFIRVRWMITGIFAVFAVVCFLIPSWVASLGVNVPKIWPWAMALGIGLANVCFWLMARNLNEESPHRVVESQIWAQILTDLVAVTLVVHFVGSTTTFISFIYLFHIVCACIIFPPKRSFLVLTCSALLYGICVALEHHNLLNGSSFIGESLVSVDHHPWLHPLFGASAIAIWFAVWYLVETLARAVVARDHQLEQANRQLRKADEEKNKIVLRTTHDLKAPFSGIESNIQVLKLKCGDELSEKAQEIIGRIERRSHSLSDRIKDILLLGNIRSGDAPIIDMETISIPKLIKEIVAELEDKAKSRNITINTELIPLELLGNSRHYHILFLNLISNAVTYSHDGDSVDIVMYNHDMDCHVSITDKGIGINEDALPHIFEEYYRTSDAASFNAKSTGLGLSIVKEIATKEGLEISVSSTKGEGTKFDVAIPGDYCSFRKKGV